MVEIPTIETSRLLLRPHRPGDFEAYAAMWADPAVVRFITAPLTREAAWARFLRQIGVWSHLGFGYFAFEEKATGVFAGEGGFHDMRRAMTPSIEGTMEAGWALVPGMQGKGLAVEAMTAALAWADRHGPAGKRITCIISPEHGASLRVAARLGFERVATTLYNERTVTVLERAL